MSLTPCWSWDETWTAMYKKECCASHSHAVWHVTWWDCQVKEKYYSHTVGHWKRHDETASKRKMQCHSPPVSPWDDSMMKLSTKLKTMLSLTTCWLWDETWGDCLAKEKMRVTLTPCWFIGWDMVSLCGEKKKWECHSPPVGFGMRHSEPTWQKRPCNDTHCLLVMTHETWLDSLA